MIIRRIHAYRAVICWGRTPADDIDICDDGSEERTYPDATSALRAIGNYISDPQWWDERDTYEIGSCWLRDDEPNVEISYTASLYRETEEWRDGRFWRRTRTAVPLTPLRLRLATGIDINRETGA